MDFNYFQDGISTTMHDEWIIQSALEVMVIEEDPFQIVEADVGERQEFHPHQVVEVETVPI